MQRGTCAHLQLSQSNRRLQHHAATKQTIFLQEVIPQGISYPGEQDTGYQCVVASINLRVAG